MSSEPKDGRRKPRLYVWTSAIALGALLVGFAILIRMNVTRNASNAEMFTYHGGGPDAGSVLWPAPAFSLQDQRGNTVSRESLLGHVWIGDFIFTTCQTQCPLLTAKMVLLQRQLTEPSLRFVSFSVDPAHDTPEALLHYAKTWNAAESRWDLLHTEQSSLSAISQGMRVTVAPTNDAKSPILHTSLFFLVDPTGGVRGVYDSNDSDAVKQLRSDTAALLKSSALPLASLPTDGEALFRAVGCPGCHENPSIAPSLRGLYESSVSLEGKPSVTADAAYLSESITAPGANVVSSYLNIMPSYAGELSPTQIDALVGYIRSLAASHSLPAPTQALPTAHGALAAASGSAALAGSVAEPAGLTRDPVCGMPVRAASTSPQISQGDRTYYFCSDTCRDKFAAQPSKYLNAPPTPMLK
ncbi:MAG: SCO family protein [Polyangiaceae bacterium]